MSEKRVTVKKCQCGDTACRVYGLRGIGNFFIGAGFSKRAAEHVADLFNDMSAEEFAKCKAEE